jgi:hypothetical protein
MDQKHAFWTTEDGVFRGIRAEELEEGTGELEEYEGVQRSSVGSQNSSRGVSSRKMTVCQWFVNCSNQLCKGAINSIKSKNPSY